MSKFRMISVLTLSLVSFSATASATDALHTGALELRMQASFARDDFTFDGEDAGSRTNGEASFFGGVFLTPWIELGVGAMYDYSKNEPEQGPTVDRSAYGVVPEIVLNLAPSGTVVPFLGAGGGVAFYSGDDVGDEAATILPRVEAGLRWFVTEAASLDFSAVYSRWNHVEGEKDLEADRFAFAIGISVFP
jgi:hypothetical protein